MNAHIIRSTKMNSHVDESIYSTYTYRFLIRIGHICIYLEHLEMQQAERVLSCPARAGHVSCNSARKISCVDSVDAMFVWCGR